MRKLTLRISSESTWALDSIFKMSEYGLPLYATMCLNIRGSKMPRWFMLC